MSDIDEIEMREQARMSAQESEEELREELHELIQQWRDEVPELDDDRTWLGEAGVYQDCADELEALLDE